MKTEIYRPTGQVDQLDLFSCPSITYLVTLKLMTSQVVQVAGPLRSRVWPVGR